MYFYAEEGGTPTPYMGTHSRHLANTIEPPVCGGDAVLCQITLTTCSNTYKSHLFHIIIVMNLGLNYSKIYLS